MTGSLITFIVSLSILLYSSRQFTKSAVITGHWLKLNPFVIGIFIVGIGTSLPELISGILSVSKGHSEILSGNIIGSNISNLLLVTGLAVALNKKPITLGSQYIYTDLHFLMGAFFIFFLIAHDGQIDVYESVFGIFVFLVYSFYLIKGEPEALSLIKDKEEKEKRPVRALLILLISCGGIYLGAMYTISSLQGIANWLELPEAIVSLTVLSLGTTLPELSVNLAAIKQGKPELAIGNVLGSCLFNTLTIPFFAGLFGPIMVSESLVQFSLPVMVASGLFFYLLTHDKKISPWEGTLFVLLYALVVFKTFAS